MHSRNVDGAHLRERGHADTRTCAEPADLADGWQDEENLVGYVATPDLVTAIHGGYMLGIQSSKTPTVREVSSPQHTRIFSALDAWYCRRCF